MGRLAKGLRGYGGCKEAYIHRMADAPVAACEAAQAADACGYQSKSSP